EILRSLPLLQRLKSKSRAGLQQEVIAFCEYALRVGTKFKLIEPFLNLWPAKIPEHVPSFYDHGHSSLDHERFVMDFEFRKASLKAIIEDCSAELKEFYPDRIKRYLESDKYKEKQSGEEEKRRFD